MLAENIKTFAGLLENFDRMGKDFGMKISNKKTKSMMIDKEKKRMLVNLEGERLNRWSSLNILEALSVMM